MRGGKSGTEGNGFIGSGRAGGQSAAASVIISKGQKGIRRVRDGGEARCSGKLVGHTQISLS